MSLPCAVPGAQGRPRTRGFLARNGSTRGDPPYPHLFQETQKQGRLRVFENGVPVRLCAYRPCLGASVGRLAAQRARCPKPARRVRSGQDVVLTPHPHRRAPPARICRPSRSTAPGPAAPPPSPRRSGPGAPASRPASGPASPPSSRRARTAAAGFTGRTWWTTSQSQSDRIAARCCFTVGADPGCVRIERRTGHDVLARGLTTRSSTRYTHRPAARARSPQSRSGPGRTPRISPSPR